MNGLATKLKLHRPHRPIIHRPSDDLGLPTIGEQRRRDKRERRYRWAWRIGVWASALSFAFIVGYNTRLSFTEARHRAEVMQQIGWTRIAFLVPQGKRKCAVDWHEGCLVCEHRSLSSTVRSTMC